jgi:hypothetical protein
MILHCLLSVNLRIPSRMLRSTVGLVTIGLAVIISTVFAQYQYGQYDGSPYANLYGEDYVDDIYNYDYDYDDFGKSCHIDGSSICGRGACGYMIWDAGGGGGGSQKKQGGKKVIEGKREIPPKRST